MDPSSPAPSRSFPKSSPTIAQDEESHETSEDPPGRSMVPPAPSDQDPTRGACLTCRKAKSKCDREVPCSRCVLMRLDCVPVILRVGRPTKAMMLERQAARLEEEAATANQEDQQADTQPPFPTSPHDASSPHSRRQPSRRAVKAPKRPPETPQDDEDEEGSPIRVKKRSSEHLASTAGGESRSLLPLSGDGGPPIPSYDVVLPGQGNAGRRDILPGYSSLLSHTTSASSNGLFASDLVLSLLPDPSIITRSKSNQSSLPNDLRREEGCSSVGGASGLGGDRAKLLDRYRYLHNPFTTELYYRSACLLMLSEIGHLDGIKQLDCLKLLKHIECYALGSVRFEGRPCMQMMLEVQTLLLGLKDWPGMASSTKRPASGVLEESNLDRSSTRQFQEAKAALEEIIGPSFQDSALATSYSLSILGRRVTYCNHRYCELFLRDQSELQLFNSDGLYAPLLWGRALKPDDHPTFFRAVAKASCGLDQEGQGAGLFSLALKFLTCQGEELVGQASFQCLFSNVGVGHTLTIDTTSSPSTVKQAT